MAAIIVVGFLTRSLWPKGVAIIIAISIALGLASVATTLANPLWAEMAWDPEHLAMNFAAKLVTASVLFLAGFGLRKLARRLSAGSSEKSGE